MAGEVVQETVSDYDGIFTFNKLPFGAYKVMLDIDQLKNLGLYTESYEKIIRVNKETPIYYFDEVKLRPSQGKAIKKSGDVIIYHKS